MEGRQIDLVQQSFAKASRFGAHVAATFYRELFAIDPSLRSLFKSDMIVQGDKLMAMLANVVANLEAPNAITPVLRDLAVRHVAYGVAPQHYDMVGTALLRTLKHELGAAFTPDTRAAWVAAYAIIASTMREAAYGAATSHSI